MCLNGFLPVVSKAYTDLEGYPWNGSGIQCLLYSDSAYIATLSNTGVFEQNSMQFKVSNQYIDLQNLSFSDVDASFVIPFNFDVYEYYIVGTIAGAVTYGDTNLDFDTIVSTVRTDDNVYSYSVLNMQKLTFNSDIVSGHSFYGKVPDTIQQSNMLRFSFVDYDASMSIGGDVFLSLSIVPVEKNSSADEANAVIIQKLLEINNNLTEQSAALQEIGQLQQETIDTIKDQYAADDSDNFGVDDVVNQVNEKAGVLSFGTDTLVNFLDLFDAANATNTKLTFPGFSMKIQGVDYQVWPDYHYDLSELENQFGALIEVVRWGCVMCVWLAVLNYLVKAYDSIFGR